ncbi:hypothetical protein [Tenacibaculum amylolyticum]|uniref:hypothetical protein n=1 Tax=Tenacibaculum amylolyticum TaxID=104269 RepID=UPI003894A1E9
MKTLFKIFVVIVLVVGLTSCGNNNEVVTQNGEIIQVDQFGIDKGDGTAPNNSGTGEDPEADDE